MTEKNYINNENLKKELVKVYDTGEISERLHLMIYEMCKKIINRPRFNRYTIEWKEDMCHNAYIKSIDVIAKNKFDITKENPFSYFTTVINNSFLDLIIFERKESNKKENLRDYLDVDINNFNEE